MTYFLRVDLTAPIVYSTFTFEKNTREARGDIAFVSKVTVSVEDRESGPQEIRFRILDDSQQRNVITEQTQTLNEVQRVLMYVLYMYSLHNLLTHTCTRT